MRLRAADQEWLWEEIERALAQQQPLHLALAAMAHSAKRGRGTVARRLSESLAAGNTLSAAVAQMGKTFPIGTAAALEVGERTGNLALSLRALSEDSVTGATFRFAIVRAVTYPVVIAVVAFVIVMAVRILLVSQFMGMYNELDIQMPFITKHITPILQVEAFVTLALPALALIVLYLVPNRLLPGRRHWDAARLSCPIVGSGLRVVFLARWCATMSTLVRAQVPEPQAVRLAGDSVGNAHVAWLSRALAARVETGVPLAEAMDTSGNAVGKFFPAPLTWMVRASEQAGGHRHVWPVARDLYRDLAERAGSIASIVLRIIFILLMVQMVAVTVVSMFLPLMKIMVALGG